MRYLTACLFILLFVPFAFAVSLDDIVKLTKLKTSDKVIIELLQKEGFEKTSLTTADVLYLKEQGVSDAVIDYLMKVAVTKTEAPSAAEPVGKNLRSYYTTTKDGKKVRVVTNLDENGKRMGGAPPPPMKDFMQDYEKEEPSKEIRVIVQHEQPPRHEAEDEEEYYDEELAGGIPLDPYYYDAPYYPLYPVVPKCHKCFGNGKGKNPPRPVSVRKPVYQRPPSAPQKFQRTVPAKSPGAGVAPRKFTR